MEMIVCPVCEEDIEVTHSSIHGQQIVFKGECPTDGEQEVVEW